MKSKYEKDEEKKKQLLTTTMEIDFIFFFFHFDIASARFAIKRTHVRRFDQFLFAIDDLSTFFFLQSQS